MSGALRCSLFKQSAAVRTLLNSGQMSEAAPRPNTCAPVALGAWTVVLDSTPIPLSSVGGTGLAVQDGRSAVATNLALEQAGANHVGKPRRRSHFQRSLAENFLGRGGVLAGALAAPAVLSRLAWSTSGEVNFMGAGRLRIPGPVRGLRRQDWHQGQPRSSRLTLDTMFAQAKLAVQTGSIDFCEPAVQLKAYVGQRDRSAVGKRRINLDGYEPNLVSGATGSLAVIGGRRYFLPSVWGTEALVYHTGAGANGYGTASLGDLFDPTMSARSPSGRIRRWPPWAASRVAWQATPSVPRELHQPGRDDGGLGHHPDGSGRAKPNVAQFWKSENEAQAAFRSNGCVLGQCWDSTGFNLRARVCRSPTSRPRKGRSPGCRATCSSRTRRTSSRRTHSRASSPPRGLGAPRVGVPANPTAKGAVDLLDPKVAAFYKAAYPGDALGKLWWWPSAAASSWRGATSTRTVTKRLSGGPSGCQPAQQGGQ